MKKNPRAATAKAASANFSGEVWITASPGDDEPQLTVGLVRFTPGARTNWHRHANGQLLVCTDGVGIVCGRDGKAIALRSGESVWTRANEEHFHGSTATDMMCHYAIVDASSGGGSATWLEPVTDEQYAAAQNAAGIFAQS